MADEFDRAMRLMRKHDPELQENGFGMLKVIAPDHVDRLVRAFRAEDDHGLRCWLLELIGITRSPAALDVLAGALDDESESIQSWAKEGLTLLDSPESRSILWQWRSNRSAGG